jgi:hypothetical protein
VSTVAVPAPARAPAAERAPAALLPAWAARLVGFAALASLGVLEWQRMIGGFGSARALLWVLIALLAAGAVLAADRLAPSLRGPAVIGAAAAALLAAFLVAGLEPGLLKPRRWDELGSGLASGAQTLSTVRLPYGGADPWPRHVLELLGAALVTLAALVAFWPRGARTRGYPFLSLSALLVLAAAPVVSLGGTRSLALGIVLAALTVCFLWLERLPLRPGLGVAAMLGVALAGALPLAAVADRGEPWFDYQSFAEGLGPSDPIRFDWGHGNYGPISWPRDGAEVLRVKAARPAYWTVKTLEDFDGSGWTTEAVGTEGEDPALDLPVTWRNEPRWREDIQISMRRMRGSDVVGAGFVMSVQDATRPIAQIVPGSFEPEGDLRAGDSYRAEVYVPRPTTAQLSRVADVSTGEQDDELSMRVHLREVTESELARVPGGDAVPRSARDGRLADSAIVSFPPFGSDVIGPSADYKEFGVVGRGETALRLSDLARTWDLAKRLRADAATPYDYVLAVDRYLRDGFTYSERPPVTAPEVSPLDGFLFDTHSGYCQHFSGAMALLLRMGGVPARVVTGFSPGGYSNRKAAWIVRDTDAHSWVEAWFDGYGWVTLDPTPSATPARSQIASLTPAQENGQTTQDAAARDAAGGGAGGGPADRRAAGEREALFERLRARGGAQQPASEDGGGPPLWPLIPAGAIAIAGIAAWWQRRRRRRGRRGPETPMDRAIRELETALRRTGRSIPSGTTLRQLEQRLGMSGEAAGYLRALSAGRYAATPRSPTATERRALRRELATGQGVRGRLRTFWALPPRP